MHVRLRSWGCVVDRTPRDLTKGVSCRYFCDIFVTHFVTFTFKLLNILVPVTQLKRLWKFFHFTLGPIGPSDYAYAGKPHFCTEIASPVSVCKQDYSKKNEMFGTRISRWKCDKSGSDNVSSSLVCKIAERNIATVPLLARCIILTALVMSRISVYCVAGLKHWEIKQSLTEVWTVNALYSTVVRYAYVPVTTGLKEQLHFITQNSKIIN